MKKQQNSEVQPDYSLTPVQKLLYMTHSHKNNPQKVKKEFIKLFGTEDIRITGDMSLDEFVKEWCKETEITNFLKNLLNEGNDRFDQLVEMLEDLPNLYTEGQKKVWFSEEVEN